jgi:hypothetical protein
VLQGLRLTLQLVCAPFQRIDLLGELYQALVVDYALDTFEASFQLVQFDQHRILRRRRIQQRAAAQHKDRYGCEQIIASHDPVE